MVATGTLRMMDGLELGDLSMARATVGSPSILGSLAVPAGRSGAFALRLNPAATQERYETYGGFSSSGVPGEAAANHYLFGFAVRFSDIGPGTEYAFFEVIDTLSSAVGQLFLEADGDMRLVNQAGSTVLTSTTPFTADTWHYIEIAIRLQAVGEYEVWIDGTTQGSGTSDFFNTVTAAADGGRFGGAGTGDGNVDIDDINFVDHTSTLQGNNLGPSEVFAYQQDQASTTSGTGLTTNDTAASGNWSLVGETVLSESNIHTWDAGAAEDGAAIFDEGANAGGHAGGPSTSAPYTVDGTIQGAQFVTWAKTDSGSGASHEIWYGNSGTTPLTVSADMALTTGYALRAFVSEVSTIVPTSTEDFAMGAGAANTDTGGKDHQNAELWAMLLHTPSAAPTVNITGVVASATAAGVVGTVASVGIVNVTGVVAAAPAAGVVGSVQSLVSTNITGVVASADAAGVAGAVTSIGIVDVTGVVAAADAAGVAGTVTAVPLVNVSITGVVASATAAGVAGTVTALVDATITGVVASADAAGVAGSVASVGIVNVTGVVAAAPAAGVAGTVESKVDTAVTGVVATVTAAGVAGTVQSHVDATIAGAVATADAAAVTGSIVSIGIVNITGVVGSADAAGVAGTVTAGAGGTVGIVRGLDTGVDYGVTAARLDGLLTV